MTIDYKYCSDQTKCGILSRLKQGVISLWRRNPAVSQQKNGILEELSMGIYRGYFSHSPADFSAFLLAIPVKIYYITFYSFNTLCGLLQASPQYLKKLKS